uniref:tRNA-5-taurinomethyluridine 2-sulfurtransferase n=1 Tax=Ixodes ricinus TaxID=34613 RepID=A0A6B0VBU0_IXORI
MAWRFRKVVCGMSGGVDSSVAAFLLRKSGYDVTGVFMRNWDPHDADSRCDLDADETDAKWVCDTLGIPFTTVDFVKPYWHNVFSPMLQEYQDGLTPNPDIICNRVIKFGAFHRHAIERFGADAVATGHYARIRNLPDGSVELLRGVDPVKDQSFFLSQVGQAALQRTLFPLGEATKGQVKALARSLGLHRVADKKESMGMCFIGKQDFQSFVEKYVEPKRGAFVDIETGKVVGGHSGVHAWTLGQRCRLGGLRSAYFVARLCPITQQILVGPSCTPLAGAAHWGAPLDPTALGGGRRTPFGAVPLQEPAPGSPRALHRRRGPRRRTHSVARPPQEGHLSRAVCSVLRRGQPVFRQCQDHRAGAKPVRRTAVFPFYSQEQRIVRPDLFV